MDLTIAKQDLLKMLKRCRDVADRRATMPILGHVLLEADSGALKVSATNLSRSISSAMACDVKDAGSLALPAHSFADRIAAMPDGPVKITVAKDKTTAKIEAVGTKRRFTLIGMPGSDFPAIPQPDDVTRPVARFTVAAPAFSYVSARVGYAVSADDTRPHLASALVEIRDGVLRMVATDGHRLAKAETPVDTGSTVATMLIPRDAMKMLRDLCAEAGDVTLSMATDSLRVYVDACGVRTSAQLINAQFPPYEQVIPVTNGCAITAGRIALRDAVKAVALSAGDKTRGVRLTVGDGAIRVEAKNTEGGDGSDEVAVDGGKVGSTAGFNAAYVIEALGAISEDTVSLWIKDELDPAVLRAAKDGADGPTLSVLMPMRI